MVFSISTTSNRFSNLRCKSLKYTNFFVVCDEFGERIGSYHFSCREVFNDDLLWRKTAAFLALSKTKIEDFHMVAWQNGVSQTPFTIVTDPKTTSIYIVVRGSTSLDDWLTDANVYRGTANSTQKEDGLLALLIPDNWVYCFF